MSRSKLFSALRNFALAALALSVMPLAHADDKVAERLHKAELEEPIGIELADHIVVNDDLERTIDEMLDIVHRRRVAGSTA